MSLQGPALMPVVAAALAGEDGRVLLQRRPPSKSMAGLWEFPGGKIEAGETPEAALARELAEELGVVVEIEAMTPVAFASAGLGARHLVLLLYLVDRWIGEPRALEASAISWFTVPEMCELDMPPADGPLIGPLQAAIAGRRGLQVVDGRRTIRKESIGAADERVASSLASGQHAGP